MDDLDRSAAGDLTRRYALALGLVALLSVAAQVVVQIALHRARTDAEVVNLAGRQRMLSQRLTLSALAWRHAQGDGAAARLATMRTVLSEWSAAHHRLESGDGLANAGSGNSPAVRRLFAAIDPHAAAMMRAAADLPGRPAAVDELLAAEGLFLAGMERIVAAYRDEAAARVQHLIALELGLCLLLLVVLALEALLVFRPAVRRLRLAILERERLRRHEAANRELQIAADTARGIGQDLHDGLGQTLTALSLQARSAGDAALAAGIAEAISQCRAHARRLAPVEIHAAGLEVALRELCEATALSAGVACSLSWTPPGPPASAAADLFRICQEALTNALRHGHARSIAVRAGPEGIEVVDDGSGGKPGQEGVGLRALRDRAARLGGSGEAGPLPAGGWLVRVRLPQ